MINCGGERRNARPTTPEDIGEIVESHFYNGKRVDRLIMILTR